jgi:hypothetical protein
MSDSIFETGNILYIPEYEFSDGDKANKLLIILKILDTENAVIQTLTTSQQYLPDSMLYHGCTNTSDGTGITDVNIIGQS